MIYRYSISTPADTAIAAPKRTDLPVALGVVHQIDILFPPGPKGYLHLKIKRGLHQIWPSNSEEWFSSDADRISFREHFEITSKPAQLEAYTYNESTTYAHTVIIRIGVLKRKFILRRLF